MQAKQTPALFLACKSTCGKNLCGFVCVCKFGWGRRARLRQTVVGQYLMRKSGCGGWMWVAGGGWEADSSDRTLFISRLRCQHSTPETSTQNSGVCTLTLTAEMRPFCSKTHPSTAIFVWDIPVFFPECYISFTPFRYNTDTYTYSVNMLNKSICKRELGLWLATNIAS